ncbi:MAG: SPOR domain-containing protein [Betaproteobacteria bacterium]|nr:SPOR domain-containing protein [Betaproteobacteria bacterium]
MKWVFFVLLAASLGLAAITTVRDRLPNPDAQLVRQQMNADQIQIVAPRPTPAPTPLASAPGPGVCLEWGSFGAIDLPRVQAALDLLALGERVRRTEVGVLTSYWIYIPPLKSKPDMDRKMVELKERGVTDYSPILEAGRWRYAISLGVYRNEDGAKKQLGLLRQKGVRSAQIGEREQRVTQTAFIVRDPNEAQSAQLVNLKTEYPGSDLRAVDCPPS